MCGRCRAFLDETLCVRCATAPDAKRRIYMNFFHRGSWIVNFLEGDLKTPIGRIRTFLNADQVREIAKRGGALKQLADHQAFDMAIEYGRGGIYLELTPEQYRKLSS